MAPKFHILWIGLVFVAQYTYSFKVVAENDPIPVEVGTRYVTSEVQFPTPNQGRTFVATTCKQFVGDSVNVTVLLTSNPRWAPLIGVVYFYVVDDPKTPKTAALCTNDVGGRAVPSCIVNTWNTTKDLYVVTQAGDVAGISFSVNVQFLGNLKSRDTVKEMRPIRNPVTMKAVSGKADDLFYLSEIVHVSTEAGLRYQHEAILNVSFCPNAETTDRYTIESVVFGTDGISSYTQYICDKLPCEVDNPNVVKSNPSQLLINTVLLTTTTAAYQQIYVLIVDWGGNYNPIVEDYVGQYQYAATITRNP
ncbi:uncharacterized protein [Ptychodera flava]|uniref:uncharacterized protein n=1 Tax=Ptychodera flava TaxID=63121 RepID=UPI003969D227